MITAAYMTPRATERVSNKGIHQESLVEELHLRESDLVAIEWKKILEPINQCDPMKV